jgi:hypothetical protein
VKFLVMWRIEIALLSREVMKLVMTMPQYAEPLEQQGKVLGRYHIPGAHGGVWIYDVARDTLARHAAGTVAGVQLLALRGLPARRHGPAAAAAVRQVGGRSTG